MKKEVSLNVYDQANYAEKQMDFFRSDFRKNLTKKGFKVSVIHDSIVIEKEDKMECEKCINVGYTSEICPTCSGSGEGLYDGSQCSECRGKGAITIVCDCDFGKDFEMSQERY